MSRFHWIIFLALAAMPTGCCFVDHDQMASTAAGRYHALAVVERMPDAKLTPDFCRQLAETERDAWEIQHARLTAAPIGSDVRARVGAGK